jgi:hypothetical protein
LVRRCPLNTLSIVRYLEPFLNDLQLLLPPLAITGAVLLGRKRAQVAVLTLSIIALVMLLLGVVMRDAAVGLRDSLLVFEVAEIAPQQLALLFVGTMLLGVGGSLAFAAVVLALSGAARSGRWGWLVGLALFGVVAVVAQVAAYDESALLLGTGRFRGTPIFLPLAGVAATAYYIVWSIVVVLAPLLPLLYSIIVRDTVPAGVQPPYGRPPSAYAAVPGAPIGAPPYLPYPPYPPMPGTWGVPPTMPGQPGGNMPPAPQS